MTIYEILSIVVSLTSLTLTIILSLINGKKISTQQKEWQKFKADLELENQKIQKERNEILDHRLSNLILRVKIDLEKNDLTIKQEATNLDSELLKSVKAE